MTSLLLIATAAFVVPALLNAGTTANTADKIDFKISALRWNGISGGSINFKIIIDLFNPTKTTLTINFLYLNINIEKKHLTTIKKENWNKQVEPESTTKTAFNVKIYFTDALQFLISSIGKLIRQGKKPENAQVKGYVKGNGFLVKINENVKII